MTDPGVPHDDMLSFLWRSRMDIPQMGDEALSRLRNRRLVRIRPHNSFTRIRRPQLSANPLRPIRKLRRPGRESPQRRQHLAVMIPLCKYVHNIVHPRKRCRAPHSYSHWLFITFAPHRQRFSQFSPFCTDQFAQLLVCCVISPIACPLIIRLLFAQASISHSWAQ